MVMHKEEDYFIPTLAPYVQWVKAYSQLITALYEEHKTVKKAWKAFVTAIPGVEQRLQFGVFEQILLFCMFLSEWNKSEVGSFASEPAVQAKASGMADPAKDIASELDTIIQNLRKIATETDVALSNSNQVHQQNALVRRSQEEYFETQVSSLEENLTIVRKEIESEDEHLERAIIELVDKSRQIGVARKQSAKRGLVQSVIQWTGSGAGQGAVRNTEPKIPVKKIGRWNAQRSRDGYFRLYRKIGGRVHSIYIGKELDVAKAERKVADRETELLKKGQMQIGATKRAVGTQRDDN